MRLKEWGIGPFIREAEIKATAEMFDKNRQDERLRNVAQRRKERGKFGENFFGADGES